MFSCSVYPVPGHERLSAPDAGPASTRLLSSAHSPFVLTVFFIERLEDFLDVICERIPYCGLLFGAGNQGHVTAPRITRDRVRDIMPI